MLRVTELRPGELGQGERDLWSGFQRSGEAGGPPASGFMHWRFAACVGDVRDDARVAVIEDEAGILAFLPYHRRPMGIARPIGAPFSDQHGPVVRPGAVLDFGAALRALKLSAYLHAAMPAGAAEPASAGPVFSTAHGYAADLTEGAEAFFARKKAEYPSRYKSLRNRAHKILRERGSVEIVADDPDRAAFDLIMTLKRKQFRRTGRHDVLGPLWTHAMFERLQSRDAPDFGLRLMTMRMDDGAVAAGEICLLWADVLHSWIAAYDPAFSDYAPGLQLTRGVIERAADLGARRVDLGAGHDHYKIVFADPTGTYLEGAVCADGPAGAARRASLSLWRAAETAPLGPAARLAGKLRRRGGQIAAVETDLAGRARGVIAALSSGRSQPA